MSTELQARARDFLQRAIPASINYVPNSIAEQLIGAYARDGGPPEDGQAVELLGLAALESSAMVETLPDPVAVDYFRENSVILELILAECIRRT